MSRRFPFVRLACAMASALVAMLSGCGLVLPGGSSDGGSTGGSSDGGAGGGGGADGGAGDVGECKASITAASGSNITPDPFDAINGAAGEQAGGGWTDFGDGVGITIIQATTGAGSHCGSAGYVYSVGISFHGKPASGLNKPFQGDQSLGVHQSICGTGDGQWTSSDGSVTINSVQGQTVDLRFQATMVVPPDPTGGNSNKATGSFSISGTCHLPGFSGL